ncbi:MAG: hybrid sensor histidine kinase/response regulator, partial [Pseudomonadota bacterium]
DTGSGIDAKDRAVIFKEFHRLDGAAQSVRGLGLGLSIVQRIAAVLDHPVEVESIVGRGTLFSVSIPRRPQGVRSIEDRRPRPMGHDVSGTIVLVIDNERDIVEGTHLLLSGWGCQVITAESEQEALERLRDDDITPDLILADYHLTDTLGTATVRAIQNALGRDVPAIIITADRTAEITEEIAAMNLTVMRKPVRPAALRAAIYQMRESPVAAAE